MSYFCIHTELINTPCGAEAGEWSADNAGHQSRPSSTVTLHDFGIRLIALPLLKHYSIVVCRLHSSIFTTTKLEDLGGFTGRIPEVSSVSIMLSPPSMRPGQIELPILNNIIHA